MILWIEKYEKYIYVNIYSDACLIDEGDSFLLTGGRWTMTRTSRYSRDRWLQDLDNLNTGRRGHACGWYTDTKGKRVRYISIKNNLLNTKYL